MQPTPTTTTNPPLATVFVWESNKVTKKVRLIRNLCVLFFLTRLAVFGLDIGFLLYFQGSVTFGDVFYMFVGLGISLILPCIGISVAKSRNKSRVHGFILCSCIMLVFIGFGVVHSFANLEWYTSMDYCISYVDDYGFCKYYVSAHWALIVLDLVAFVSTILATCTANQLKDDPDFYVATNMPPPDIVIEMGQPTSQTQAPVDQFTSAATQQQYQYQPNAATQEAAFAEATYALPVDESDMQEMRKNEYSLTQV